MRVRRVALALGLTAVIATTVAIAPVRPLAGTATAAVRLAPTADDLTDALTALSPHAWGTSLSAGYVPEPDGGQGYGSAGVLDSSVAGFPSDGATAAVLSTGDAGFLLSGNHNDPDDPGRDDDRSRSWGSDQGGPGDVTTLRLLLRPAPNATCLTFDFRFLTEEYGDGSVTAGDDFFVAKALDDPSDPVGDLDPSASFARGPSGEELTARALVDVMTPEEAVGTTYDAATPVLSAATPIDGETSIVLSVADEGDNRGDTAVLVDAMRVGRPVDGRCAPGAVLDTHEVVLSPLESSAWTGRSHQVSARLWDHDASPSLVAGEPILFARTGANAGTGSDTTDDLGFAHHRWTGTAAGTDTITACWDANGSGTCDAAETGETLPATVSWDVALQLRAAFTDASDRVAGRRLSYRADGTVAVGDGTSPWSDESEHVGEVSAAGPYLAGISTAEHPAGEVHVRWSDSSGWSPVTCDEARQSHPVVWPEGGWVAFASDGVGENDGDGEGDWDIYVAMSAIGFASSGPARGCGGWLMVNATASSPGDDLWPSWTEDGDLVYSSTIEDPLGDIYRLEREGDAWPSPPERLTSSAAADTQPAVGRVDGREVVAFTTTEDSPRGRVAVLVPGDPEDPADPGTIVDPLPAVEASSEAAWGQTGDDRGAWLTWTTTDQDPAGDVQMGYVRGGSTSGSWDTILTRMVSGRPGVAETHPAWIEPLGLEPGLIAHTVDDPAADVGDVHVEDGAQRRVLVGRVLPDPEFRILLDDREPTYSPDGSRIIHSADALPGHEVRSIDSDGGDAETLAVPTAREPRDVDTDPAWSHDGSRLAWTRSEDADGPVQVWVTDLSTGGPVRLTPDEGEAFVEDRTPAWSPDDEWLVVARGEPANSQLVLLATDGSGAEVVLEHPPSDDESLPVEGRTPAWSPDGTRIAYARDRQLEYVDLPAAAPPADAVAAGRWTVSEPRVVVGFEDRGGVLEATAAREVLEAATEPDWSPDGNRLLVTGQPAGQPDLRGLWLVDVEGTGADDPPEDEPVPEVLTDEPGPETDPAWQRRPADVGVSVTVAGSPAAPGAPLTATFTLTNNGPGPAAGVVLAATYGAGATTSVPTPPPGCAADGTGCTVPVLASGASVVHTVTLSHASALSAAARGVVTSTTADLVPANDAAQAPYDVVPPPPDVPEEPPPPPPPPPPIDASEADLEVTLALDSDTGWVGGRRAVTIVVRNAGPDPAEQVDLDLDLPDVADAGELVPLDGAPPCDLVGCELGTLEVGASRSWTLELVPAAEGEDDATASVAGTTPDPELEDNTDVETLTVLQPRVLVLPGVSRPGKAVLVFGEDMPPGTEVELSWTKGVMTAPGPYAVEADGTFTENVFVVRRDRLGRRQVVATSTTGEFTPVRATLLVAYPTMVALGDIEDRG